MTPPASVAIVDVSRCVSLADFSSVHGRSIDASAVLSSVTAFSLMPTLLHVSLVTVTVTVTPPPPTNRVAVAIGAQIHTKSISTPPDIVGCIIARAGTMITETCRLSSNISIAKAPHGDTGERMSTIQGTPDANEEALYLLSNQLDSDEWRVSRGLIQQ